MLYRTTLDQHTRTKTNRDPKIRRVTATEAEILVGKSIPPASEILFQYLACYRFPVVNAVCLIQIVAWVLMLYKHLKN